MSGSQRLYAAGVGRDLDHFPYFLGLYGYLWMLVDVGVFNSGRRSRRFKSCHPDQLIRARALRLIRIHARLRGGSHLGDIKEAQRPGAVPDFSASADRNRPRLQLQIDGQCLDRGIPAQEVRGKDT